MDCVGSSHILGRLCITSRTGWYPFQRTAPLDRVEKFFEHCDEIQEVEEKEEWKKEEAAEKEEAEEAEAEEEEGVIKDRRLKPSTEWGFYVQAP